MPCPPCGVLYMYVPSVQRNNGYAVPCARKSRILKCHVIKHEGKNRIAVFSRIYRIVGNGKLIGLPVFCGVYKSLSCKHDIGVVLPVNEGGAAYCFILFCTYGYRAAEYKAV